MRAADIILAALLASAAAGVSHLQFARLSPALLQYRAGPVVLSDLWFDADIPRMGCLMTDRSAVQYSVTAEHPLIGWVTFVPHAVVTALMPGPSVTTIGRVTAMLAGVWVATLFFVLRALGFAMVDAALFSVLAVASAAGLFWVAIPEIYTAGSITLLLPIGAAAVAGRWPRLAVPGLTLAAAMSMGVTITNVLSGIAAAASQPWRRAVQIVANALAIVALAWAIQAAWAPNSRMFLGTLRGAGDWRELDRSAVTQVLAAMFSHSMVMPAIAVTTDDEHATRLTVQEQRPPIDDLLGGVSIALWLSLLLLGVTQLPRASSAGPARGAVAAVLAGQVLLHLLVGRETFLYSLHFAPLLTVAAAFATRSRRPTLVRVATSVLIVAVSIHNARRFDQAVDIVNTVTRDVPHSLAVPAAQCH